MTRAFTSICAFCGSEHECTSAIVNKPAPDIEPAARPGDCTMCIYCGEFNIIDRNNMLRRPTHSEARRLKRDPRVQKVWQAWHALQEGKKSHA